MILGAVRKNKNLQGFFDNGLIQLDMLERRHDDLAWEMKNRGYRHSSPLDLSGDYFIGGYVDRQKSLRDLAERCSECRKRMNRVSQRTSLRQELQTVIQDHI